MLVLVFIVVARNVSVVCFVRDCMRNINLRNVMRKAIGLSRRCKVQKLMAQVMAMSGLVITYSRLIVSRLFSSTISVHGAFNWILDPFFFFFRSLFPTAISWADKSHSLILWSSPFCCVFFPYVFRGHGVRQLYVKGELVGGLDIIKEMKGDGPLASQLGITTKVCPTLSLIFARSLHRSDVVTSSTHLVNTQRLWTSDPNRS